MKGGLFTGVGLSRYLDATADDPVNARRIINSFDCAVDIAAIYAGSLAGLAAAVPASAEPAGNDTDVCVAAPGWDPEKAA
jgi:hypothetical protein